MLDWAPNSLSNLSSYLVLNPALWTPWGLVILLGLQALVHAEGVGEASSSSHATYIGVIILWLKWPDLQNARYDMRDDLDFGLG